MKIYAINCDRSIHRYLTLKKHIKFERVKPVEFRDPQMLELQQSWNPEHKAELSLQLTVARIIEKETEPFLLLEDDCIFDSDPIPVLNKIQELPSNFTLCYLGCYLRPYSKGNLIKYNDNFFSIVGDHMIWGCHSIIYNPPYCKMIVDAFNEKKQIAIDGWLSNNIVGKFPCFLSNPLLAWQSGDVGFHGKYNFDEIKKDSIDFFNKFNTI